MTVQALTQKDHSGSTSLFGATIHSFALSSSCYPIHAWKPPPRSSVFPQQLYIMIVSLANHNANSLGPQKHHPEKPDTSPFQVQFKTLNTSLTFHLPDIDVDPEPTTKTSESTAEDALTRHSAWKKSTLPWNDSSAARVVLAMRYAFPDLEDAASLAGIAATYVMICEVDDVVENMDRQTATDCIMSGIAILDRSSPVDEGGMT